MRHLYSTAKLGLWITIAIQGVPLLGQTSAHLSTASLNQPVCTQTSAQWLDKLKDNKRMAQQDLVTCFEAVRDEAAAYYKNRGNGTETDEHTRRSWIVRQLLPDMHNLQQRISLAEDLDPSAAIKDVIRAYIKEASLQLLRASH